MLDVDGWKCQFNVKNTHTLRGKGGFHGTFAATCSDGHVRAPQPKELPNRSPITYEIPGTCFDAFFIVDYTKDI